jgi:hypothetical protein
VVVLGVGTFVVLLALVLWLSAPRPYRGFAPEQDLGAQAEIEESDIEMMIEARNAIRRRRGLPEIGDELAEQLRGGGSQDFGRDVPRRVGPGESP